MPVVRGALAASLAFLVIAVVLFSAACSEVDRTLDVSEVSSDPWEANAALARTINLGGVFEVGRGEQWGPDFQLDDVDSIAAAGFTAIRIPARWSDWSGATAPYAIEDEFFDRLDPVIDRAVELDLAVVVDVHHFDALNDDPAANRLRFLAIWRQISAHYVDQPASVIFEILNEPNGELVGDDWTRLVADAVRVIRVANPGRTIIVGPALWYRVLDLPELTLPDDDNLIASFHYYEPFVFTHQGAGFIEGAEAWLGTPWGTDEDRAVIADQFAGAAAWANEQDRPMFLGEFGVLSEASREDRLEWLRFVRTVAESNDFSWGYWDWATVDFGAFDDGAEAWDDELIGALISS